MTKTEAKIIANTITNEQLFNMLNAAKTYIFDWNVRSLVNKGLSKGVSWNILGKDFDIDYNYHHLTKCNLVREFGEFLPPELRVEMKKRKPLGKFIHHKPNFDGWE